MSELLKPMPQILSPHKPVGYVNKNRANARNSILPSPVPFRMKPKKKSWISMKGRRALFYCLALTALAYIVISSVGSGSGNESDGYELAAPNEFVGIEPQKGRKPPVAEVDDSKVVGDAAGKKKGKESNTEKGVKIELELDLVESNNKKVDQIAGNLESTEDKKVVVLEKGRTNKDYDDSEYEDSGEYMDKMDKKKAAVMNRKKKKGSVVGKEQ